MQSLKLLPHQREFIYSNKDTILLAGFGSGKSFAGVVKTVTMKMKYPKHKVAYYLPSYPLIRDIAFDKFTQFLDDYNFQYTLNKTDKEIHIHGFNSIIFRTMSEPESIVGYEVAYSLIDEADVMPKDKMEMAYNKIIGRNRAVDNAIIDMVSTPEGFGFLYEKVNTGRFEVIRAKTTDNKFISQSYIDSLKEQYPEELLRAYLNGEFVNFNSAMVWNFKREINSTDRTEEPKQPLVIGQDFNIGGCVSIVHIEDGMGMYAIDEIVSRDTFDVIHNIKARYKDHPIEIIPDASGRAGKTNASKSDIQMLIDAGFKVNAPKTNPRVQDRINATNNMFEKRRYFVNVKRCPRYTQALEQQAYDKNGEPQKHSGAATIDDFADAGTYPIARKYGIKRTSVQGVTIDYA